MDYPKPINEVPHILEWEGVSLDKYEWAKRLGICYETMERRLNRYRHNDMPFAKIFAKPTKSYKETETLKKTILFEYLMAFKKTGMHSLQKETKHYMATGEKGPAMKWVENNKALLMNTKTQEHTKADKPAQLAIFLGGQVPQDITVIEGK